MSRLLRLLRPGVVTLLPLLFLPLRAAEAPPPPAEETQPAAEAATPATEPPAAAEEVEEAPLEPISADNNLTFPVDI